jgi:hypothetical protein
MSPRSRSAGSQSFLARPVRLNRGAVERRTQDSRFWPHSGLDGF